MGSIRGCFDMMVASVAIPATGIFYFLFVEEDYLVLLIALMSVFVIAMGAFAYAGVTDGTGLEEESVLDLKAVSDTVGLMLFAAAFVSFFGMLAVCWLFGTWEGMVMWIVLFLGTTIAAVIELHRPKYRTGPEH